MSEIKELRISIGALSPPLKQQLNSQGYTMNDDEIYHLQKDADAIVRLLIRSYISHTTADKASQKLMKKICKQAETQAGEASHD